jgi:ribosomal protein S18 acetylase RimI-like enzyme
VHEFVIVHPSLYNFQRRQTLVYREWTHDDIEPVRRVLLDTWLATYSSFIPEEDIRSYFAATYSAQQLELLCALPSCKGYVALEDDEVVGFERLQFSAEENRLYVASVYVLPRSQGKGLGRHLLMLAEDLARTLELDRIWLGVMVQNTASVEWYKKIGFTFDQEEPFTMGGTVVQHLIGYKLVI